MVRQDIQPAVNPKLPWWRYFFVIISGFVIMLCGGTNYAWSVFVNPLRNEYGLTTTDTQFIFGLIGVLFSIFNCFTSRVERKLGPRKTTILGALSFGLGYSVASFSNGNIVILIIGLAIFNAIGMALAYMTVVSTINRWLPNYKGLATGIVMSGWGGSAVLVANMAQPLMNGGMDVLSVFRLISILMGSLYLLAALLLSNPPWVKLAEIRSSFHFSYAETLRDRRYWVLTATCFCAALAPLLFYGNLKPLGLSLGIQDWAATLGITLMSIGNVVGRLVWGLIGDRIGSRRAIQISILCVVAMTVLMWAFMRGEALFIVMVLAFGFCFGSDSTLYALNVGSVWGVEKIGPIYPLIFMAYGFASIAGPMLGGAFYDRTGSYAMALLIGSAVCFMAFLIYSIFMPRDSGGRTPLRQSNQ